jgi:hypothetical protein
MKRFGMMGRVGGPNGEKAAVRNLIFRLVVGVWAPMAVGGLLFAGSGVRGLSETCTTQSAMTAADRGAIADAARSLAEMVKANDAAGLRAASVAEMAKDFGGLQYLLGTTSPKLAGATLSVDQVYLLDATMLKPNADGTPVEGQFFCSLNRSTMEAEFTIPALPAGKYAFAIVTSAGEAGNIGPWRLSMLMRQDTASNRWMLAGLYPSAMTAAGHDGVWYWKQARAMVTAKQPWNAWLYYQAAAKLLQPARFVDSTHLEKLRTEQADAAPSALSEGVSVDAPLVIKGADGVEYHFTGLGVDNSPGQSALDVAAHLRVDDVGDAAAARKRNNDAAAALLTAYPELRNVFHGVWIYADAAGKSPFGTEEAMTDVK